MNSLKNILLLGLLLVKSYLSAQQTISSFQPGPEPFNLELTEFTYPVYDESTRKFDLLFFNASGVWQAEFNSEGIFQSGKYYNLDRNNFPNLISTNITADYYHLWFASKKHRKLLTAEYNRAEKTWINMEINPLPKTEEYVASVIYNDQFYVISNSSETSILNLYRQKDVSLEKVGKFDLSSGLFGEGKTLNNLLSTAENKKNRVKIIRSNVPATLPLASKQNKLYQNGEELILTLDHSARTGTHLVSINLKTLQSNYEFKGFSEVNEDTLKTVVGSYLHNDIFGQLMCHQNKLIINLYKWNELSSIAKSISVNKGQVFDSKNFDNTINVPPHQQNAASVQKVATTMLLRNIVSDEDKSGLTLETTPEGHLLLKVGIAEKKHFNNRRGGGTGGGGGGGRMRRKDQNSKEPAPVRKKGWNTVKNGNNALLNLEKQRVTHSKYAGIVMDAETLTYKPDAKLNTSIYDQVNAYEKAINKSPFDSKPARTLFPTNEGYIFGYFEADAGKYVLLKF